MGGTWWHNRYPGAACDVPSHFYCYSFEPNPDWSRLHAPQPEIQAYIERCAEKYAVMPHVELGKAITGLSWDVKRSLWSAAFADGDTAEARFVINGMGALHQPKIPQFRGADTFTGETMHTACWNPDFDPAGKRIAVIGSAASAIQAVPELARTAAMVHLFQRTPNYIAPRNDYAYSDEQRTQFRSDPDAMRAERERIFNEAETRLWSLIVDQASRDRTRELLKLYLGTQVRNRKYRAALTPGFDVGCKRLLFSDDFLASLNEDNVELVTEPIREITETAVVTSRSARSLAAASSPRTARSGRSMQLSTPRASTSNPISGRSTFAAKTAFRSRMPGRMVHGPTCPSCCRTFRTTSWRQGRIPVSRRRLSCS